MRLTAAVGARHDSSGHFFFGSFVDFAIGLYQVSKRDGCPRPQKTTSFVACTSVFFLFFHHCEEKVQGGLLINPKSYLPLRTCCCGDVSPYNVT